MPENHATGYVQSTDWVALNGQKNMRENEQNIGGNRHGVWVWGLGKMWISHEKTASLL